MDDATIAAELLRRAEQMELEAKRLRVAARVLDGKRIVDRQLSDPEVASTPVRNLSSGRSETGHSRAANTIPMIRRTLRKRGPLDYRDLTDAMLEDGWETESRLPRNTVRTALSRLHERGLVARQEDGRYELLESSGRGESVSES